MRSLIIKLLAMAMVITACAPQQSNTVRSTLKLDAARNIVDAVNAKDSGLYVRDLADDVVVKMYNGEVRLSSKDAVKKNRENHFLNHPQAQNELVHLVEIDNRVVMHDQVWLDPEDVFPADIVEVFTFKGNEIVQIDVIQPGNLFARE